MSEEKTAKRYYVSGQVQGVGFRYFVMRVAARLGVSGYVKNLRDGRVEVYAIGSHGALGKLRGELKRGPSMAFVEQVGEEEVTLDAAYLDDFIIERNAW